MTRLRQKLAPILLSLAPLCAAAASSQTLAKAQESLALGICAAQTNEVEITDGENSVVFHPGYRRISLNGITAWLNGPAEPDAKDTLTLGTNDVERFLSPAIDGYVTFTTNSPLRVFIDAGHGGDDCGAIAPDGQREKDVALDIARRLGVLLGDAGLQVYYSRTNDIFIPLGVRSEKAAEALADVFVSIHCNTTGSKAAKGVETFALAFAGSESTSADSRISRNEYPGNAFDSGSSALGYLIHSCINMERGEADRGLRHARFQVLRQAPCPAVLVECGFLSNRAENKSLSSARYRERMARAIADGIVAYAELCTAFREAPAEEAPAPGEASGSEDSAPDDAAEEAAQAPGEVAEQAAPGKEEPAP